MSEADKQILIELAIIGPLWVGGGLTIIYRSFKRRNISRWNLLNPAAIFMLQGRDYLYLLGLLLITIFSLKVLLGVWA